MKLFFRSLFSLVSIAALSVSVTALPASADVISAFVDSATTDGSGRASGGAQYDFASATMNLDPALTTWVCWADFWGPPTNPGPFTYAGGEFVGAHGYGTDDWIRLTIANPSGASATLDLDWNNSSGGSSGPQMIIFGDAADAPEVRRQSLPSSDFYYINEAGAFNSTGIFTGSGQYTFDFSFRNQYTSSAGHNEIHLLANVVPEPSPFVALLGVGLVGVLGRRRRCETRSR